MAYGGYGGNVPWGKCPMGEITYGGNVLWGKVRWEMSGGGIT